MLSERGRTLIRSPIQDKWSSRRHYSVIHLMVKDPYTLFAYWDITDRKRAATEQHYRMSWHRLTKKIRLYAVTDQQELQSGSVHYFDVNLEHLEQDRDSVYIHSIEPDQSYIADYGILNSSLQFIPVVRSAAIRTPRSLSAASADSEETAAARITSLSAQPPSSESSSPFEQFSAYTLYPNREGVRK